MRRESWIVEEYEERIHALIANEARAQGAKVLAINGMHDHIHLVVEMPTQVSISKFMQHVKGTSSTIIRNTILPEGSPFGWQENYGVFSFHKNHKESVCNYVHNQKEHHSKQTLLSSWEEADEENNAAKPHL